MAKNRDSPIHHNWLLLIIDECLTVQINKCTMDRKRMDTKMMSKTHDHDVCHIF